MSSSSPPALAEPIADGTQVNILQRHDSWCEVTLVAPGRPENGQRGFVRTIYINEEPAAREPVFEEKNPPGPHHMTGLIQSILHITADSKFGTSTTTAVRRFQQSKGLPQTGKVDRATGEALGLTNWMNGKDRVLAAPFSETSQTAWHFKSLTKDGFFSHWPDAPRVLSNPLTARALRTNNPGAINRASWRKSFPGFVGNTHSDGSDDDNVTMVFSSPEYGVAAWRFWFWRNVPNKISATVAQIVEFYRGGGPPAEPYLRDYYKYSNGLLDRNTVVQFNDNEQMFLLARSVFSHEASYWFPLSDEQFRTGIRIGMEHIEREKNESMRERITRNAYEFGVSAADAMADFLPR
ncbi:hypothetical protein GIW81_09475 [Hyphomicrobium sp. xq]|uniref:Peptidoglycan binding-like domain-containing protein n=2 Tax=Hyphomicrobium album TaxID=2665159 RepID=A0A6I3KKV5_9HYPH|nr:hypothetical protein [Hyphomicrobium album]